jgi:hypothetical protein
LECAWQLFVTNLKKKIKIIDSMIKLKGLDTFNVHIIYNMDLFTTIGRHIMILGDMFLSLKYSIIKFLWLTNIKILCFWSKCLSKSNNFQKSPNFTILYQVWCMQLVKFSKCKKLYYVTIILEDSSVLMPKIVLIMKHTCHLSPTLAKQLNKLITINMPFAMHLNHKIIQANHNTHAICHPCQSNN